MTYAIGVSLRNPVNDAVSGYDVAPVSRLPPDAGESAQLSKLFEDIEDAVPKAARALAGRGVSRTTFISLHGEAAYEEMIERIASTLELSAVYKVPAKAADGSHPARTRWDVSVRAGSPPRVHSVQLYAYDRVEAAAAGAVRAAITYLDRIDLVPIWEFRDLITIARQTAIVSVTPSPAPAPDLEDLVRRFVDAGRLVVESRGTDNLLGTAGSLHAVVSAGERALAQLAEAKPPEATEELGEDPSP